MGQLIACENCGRKKSVSRGRVVHGPNDAAAFVCSLRCRDSYGRKMGWSLLGSREPSE